VPRSLTQRRILEQAEPVARLIANVFGHDTVQIFFPGCVLIDKTIRLRFVSFVLDRQRLGQRLPND